MTEQREVAPQLKERFDHWIDLRTARGVSTYGEPLKTHNGRNGMLDMTEELVDFLQYQQQYGMELQDRADYLERALVTLNGPHWETML